MSVEELLLAALKKIVSDERGHCDLEMGIIDVSVEFTEEERAALKALRGTTVFYGSLDDD